MAAVTVTIPNSNWLTIGSFYTIWQPPRGSRLSIGAELSAIPRGFSVRPELFLGGFWLSYRFGHNRLALYFSQTAQNFTNAEFSSDMLLNGTITLTASDNSSIELAIGSDRTNPYDFDDDESNALRSFAQAFIQLSNKRLTVTLNDGANVELPEVDDAAGNVNESFTVTLPEATSGTAPYTYTATPLPAGLEFDASTRVISGTPTTEGTVTVSYSVTDSSDPALTASVEFDIVVGPRLPVELPTVADQSGTRRTAFTAVTLPEATRGLAPYTYAVTGLPTGLEFDANTRVISGTPGAVGTATVTYTATDSTTPAAGTARVSFDIEIADLPAPALPEIDDQSASRRSEVTVTLPEASDGVPGYTYAVDQLPTGLMFNAGTRVISGTPTVEETVTVTYTATDSDSPARQASRSFDFTIAAPAALSLPEVANQSGTRRKAFSVTLPAAMGGFAPYTYSVSDNLPDGLEFDADNRIISGTPTATATVTVVYTVTDSDDPTTMMASRSFTLTIADLPAPALPVVSDQTGTRRTSLSVTLPEASNGFGAYTYSVDDLPTGLSFDPDTRVISGRPTVEETVTVTYTATDSDIDSAGDPAPRSASRSFDFTIEAPEALSLPTPPDGSGRRRSAFSLTLPAATGGFDPYTYRVSMLPAGLSFDPDTLTISGTPTAAGTTTVTYTVTDSDTPDVARDSDTFDIVIADIPVPALPAVRAQGGVRRTAFTATLPPATGGHGAYTYEVSALPAGLEFDANTRVISGTPTTVQTVTVVYTATDSDTPARSATRSFTFTIADLPAPALRVIGNQSRVRRSSVRITLPIATGGVAPYTYEVSALPAGLEFDANTRVISGTPTTAGNTRVTYTATDSDTPARSASRTFTFTIAVPAPVVLPVVADRDLRLGQATSFTLPAASRGVAPYTYSVVDLPSGLSFDPRSRVVRGRPTVSGDYRVVYRAFDSDDPRSSNSRSFTLTVRAPLALPSPGRHDILIDERFTLPLPPATGGTPDYTYTLTGLPDGFIFDADTRIITGISTVVTSANITYRVTDDAGARVAVTFSIHIAEPPDLDFYRLEVDWNGNGAFDHRLTNVWKHVQSLSASRGRNFEEMVYGRSIAGRLRADLRNDLGLYDRFNVRSELRGLVVPGRRVRLRMRSSLMGEYETIWAGQLSEIDPHPERSGNDEVSMVAYGPLSELSQREISVAMQTGTRRPATGASAYDPPNAHKTAALPAGVSGQGIAFDDTQYVCVSGRDVHTFRGLQDVGDAHPVGKLPNPGNRGGVTYRSDRGVLVSVIGTSIEVWTATNPAGAVTRATGASGNAAFVGICWDGSHYVLIRSDRTVWHFTDETDPDNDITQGGTLSQTLVGGAALAGGIDWDGSQYVVGTAGSASNRLLLFTDRNNPGAAVSAGDFSNGDTWLDGDVCWDGERIIMGRRTAGTGNFQGAAVDLYDMALVAPTRFRTAESTITTAVAFSMALAAAAIPSWQRGRIRGTRTMSRWWVSRQRAIESLRQIEETEGGILYESKDGRISMDAENSRVSNVAHHTLNADGVADIPVVDARPRDPVKDIVNIVRVPVRNYEVGPLETIWSLTSAVTIEGNETITFVVEYPPPSNPAAAVGVEEWTPMDPTEDYEAYTSADDTSVSRNDDLSIITTDTATSRTMTVLNCSATALVVTKLQTRGRILTEAAPTVIEERDPGSIIEYRERSYLIPAQFISDTRDAHSYASTLLFQLKQPQTRVNVTAEMSDHRAVAQELDISDKVTLVMGGRRDEMFVEAIEHVLGQGKRHNVDLLLSPTESIANLFVIGTSQLGVGVLGR